MVIFGSKFVLAEVLEAQVGPDWLQEAPRQGSEWEKAPKNWAQGGAKERPAGAKGGQKGHKEAKPSGGRGHFRVILGWKLVPRRE